MTYTPPNYDPPKSLAELLVEAQWKLHKLQTGQLPSEVEYDGKGKVRFRATTIDELKAYIDELTDKINGETPRYGAVGFIF